MKKKMMVTIFGILFVLNTTGVHAQPLKESYATPEDVFLEMIKLDIHDILMEKHENLVNWNYSDKAIIDLQLVHEQFNPKWFEITFSVVYEQMNSEGKAIIEVKIIPATFLHNSTSTKIELIRFTDARKVH